MSSNRQINTNYGRTKNSSRPTEASTPHTKTTLRLFDEALSRNNYILKNPSANGREYMVDKFNRAFNMNISKLDEFKKKYKGWKNLMIYIGMQIKKKFEPKTARVFGCEGTMSRITRCTLTISTFCTSKKEIAN
ncbi:hypothetical protein HID58_006492 [Brassica napus]|uniref:Myb/SANT-like domain-containing protein n=1 Tax=Brassica napus TaxID=3708 RepID=A0ABQ8EBJ2_BRANA|nr:hypothetical protein HID58_006492 [Brassica napus]